MQRPMPRTLLVLLPTLLAATNLHADASLDPQGFVRSWLVLAPIPFPHEPTGKAQLAATQVSNEASLRPLAGQYVKLPERELVWLEHHAPEAAIDFGRFVDPGRALEALGYAVTYLITDTARDDLRLEMGSSDQGKVYVNGRPLLVHDTPRDYKPAQDVAPLRLVKGLNTVVFKVVNTGGAWKGSLRIVDRAGKPATGLQAALHPRRDVADHFPLDAEGYVRSWLLLAPIAYVPRVVGRGQLHKQQVPGEAKLRPRAGESVRLADKTLTWRAVQAADERVDFAQVAGPGAWNAVAGYAVAYVHAPQKMTGLKLKVGSNDQGKVYLNGKPVLAFDAPRSLRPDQDVVGGLTLNEGLNVIVFKVLNTERAWQGCLRFTDAQDRPVTALRTTLEPG